MPEAVSGLAASIRSSVESETFDLAGQAPSTIEKMVHDAFSEPLALSEMIRITFITGAGKLGRQKYDEGAARVLTSTLRDLGYEEDRGASAVMECAGSFKLQHDTGKNLKTVVVFPKIIEPSSDMAGLSLEDKKVKSLIPENSPEHKIAYSSMSIFQKMITSTCLTWSQKKGCATAIESVKEQVDKLDQKLVKGEQLSESEQDFYDSVSAASLEEKLAWTKEQMHKHVDDGKITADERKLLLEQVTDRIETLTEEIAEADQEGKKKRVENLTAAKTKAEERKKRLQNITPVAPPPLKNQGEINKLRKELIPLLQIEDAAKGRLLTLKESQAVSRKDEIDEEINQLEQSSRGWFESDESFKARVKLSQAAWEQQLRQSKKANKKSASKTSSGKAWNTAAAAPAASTTKFVTPATKKVAAAVAKPKPKAARGGGVFAAMMMDDSDSD